MTTPLRHGDTLMLDDPRVVGLHSIDVAEDGQTVLMLLDLADGSTGAASWHWRDPPGACRTLTVVAEAGA
jgi:hypothetical protein